MNLVAFSTLKNVYGHLKSKVTGICTLFSLFAIITPLYYYTILMREEFSCSNHFVMPRIPQKKEWFKNSAAKQLNFPETTTTTTTMMMMMVIIFRTKTSKAAAAAAAATKKTTHYRTGSSSNTLRWPSTISTFLVGLYVNVRSNKIRQCTYDVATRRVRVTNVAMPTQHWVLCALFGYMLLSAIWKTLSVAQISYYGESASPVTIKRTKTFM